MATYELMGSSLEISGQPLPIVVNDRDAYCFNATECVDCLDEVNTEWVVYDNGIKSNRIKSYHFLHAMMPAASLFKIPSDGGVRLLAQTGVSSDEADDFYYIVNKHKIEGLTFRCVFNDSIK